MTGYIGGDLFHEIYTAHPDWDYTCLVRSSDKAAPVAAKYPSVHFAYGNGSDAALLEEEASKADIIVRKYRRGMLSKRSDFSNNMQILQAPTM